MTCPYSGEHRGACSLCADKGKCTAVESKRYKVTDKPRSGLNNNKFKELREEKGLSYTNLAKLTTLRRDYIISYETGAIVPSTKTIIKIANALEVPYNILID